MRTKYQYHLGSPMLLLQKDFKIQKKTLYSYKDKAGTFEKYQHNQSHDFGKITN